MGVFACLRKRYLKVQYATPVSGCIIVRWLRISDYRHRNYHHESGSLLRGALNMTTSQTATTQEPVMDARTLFPQSRLLLSAGTLPKARFIERVDAAQKAGFDAIALFP